MRSQPAGNKKTGPDDIPGLLFHEVIKYFNIDSAINYFGSILQEIS